MSRGFASLSIQRSSRTAIKGTAEVSALADHTDSLRQEVRDILDSIPNSWLRDGSESGIQRGIKELAKKLQSPSDPSDQPRREPAKSAHSDFMKIFTVRSNADGDIESGSPEPARYLSKLRKVKRADETKFHGVYASIHTTMLGRFYITTQESAVEAEWRDDSDRSSDSEEEEKQLPHRQLETKFIFIPSAWLWRVFMTFGFEISVRRGSEWKNTFRTFRTVPDNAHIFEFCRNGNISAVRTLLKRGEASPWDTDSKGWTPLHVSVFLSLRSIGCL